MLSTTSSNPNEYQKIYEKVKNLSDESIQLYNDASLSENIKNAAIINKTDIILDALQEYKKIYRRNLANLKKSNVYTFQNEFIPALFDLTYNIFDLTKTLLRIESVTVVTALLSKQLSILKETYEDIYDKKYKINKLYLSRISKHIGSYATTFAAANRLSDSQNHEKIIHETIDLLNKLKCSDYKEMIGTLVISLLSVRVEQGWLDEAKSLLHQYKTDIPVALYLLMNHLSLAEKYLKKGDIANSLYFYNFILTQSPRCEGITTPDQKLQLRKINEAANERILFIKHKAIEIHKASILEEQASSIATMEVNNCLYLTINPDIQKLFIAYLRKKKILFKQESGLVIIENAYTLNKQSLVDILRLIIKLNAKQQQLLEQQLEELPPKQDTPASSSTEKLEENTPPPVIEPIIPIQPTSNVNSGSEYTPRLKEKTKGMTSITPQTNSVSTPKQTTLNSYFDKQYANEFILSFGRAGIPDGIYCGFFKPIKAEKIDNETIEHHKAIFKSQHLATSRRQGIQFIKTTGKYNLFKTKDSSKDYRCVAKLVQVAKDEEGRERYLYQFGEFMKHDEIQQAKKHKKAIPYKQ